MVTASVIYDNEDKRRATLTPILGKILGVNIQSIVNDDKTNPDGIVEVAHNMVLSLQSIKEDKNEIGDGGSDPSTQAGLSAGRSWAQERYKVIRNATGCPTFLIATAGPWIVVLGAVITDGVIVQRLSDYVWVGLDTVLFESHILCAARVFFALKTSLAKLDAFYARVPVHPTSDLPSDSRYFPSITAYRQGDRLVKFEYIGFLENTPDCATLRARTISGQGIVVKFVDRYGERAHRIILAEQNLAPKLLYCGSPQCGDDQPSYRSITMVVMEFVDGETFAEAKRGMNEETLVTVRSMVERAIGVLHANGLVFGDLRSPNVMITKDGRVKLIDFNWAGVEGQAKYPSLISKEIPWPDGVQARDIIERNHDLAMLDKLFRRTDTMKNL